jgi:hypothetical protein
MAGPRVIASACSRAGGVCWCWATATLTVIENVTQTHGGRGPFAAGARRQGVIASRRPSAGARIVIQVTSEDDIMLITDGGSLRAPAPVRFHARPQHSGVRLIRPREDEKLVGLEPFNPGGGREGEAGPRAKERSFRSGPCPRKQPRA